MAPTTQGRKFLSVHQDVAIGFGLLVGCAVLFWMTTRFPDVPPMLSQNVPPTFFPRLVLAVISLLSLLLIARGLATTRASKEPVKKRVFVTAGIVAASIALMQPLGMLLTVSLLAVALPLSWGERRYRRLAVLALALPLAIHLTFTLALGIRFPRGLLAVFFS